MLQLKDMTRGYADGTAGNASLSLRFAVVIGFPVCMINSIMYGVLLTCSSPCGGDQMTVVSDSHSNSPEWAIGLSYIC